MNGRGDDRSYSTHRRPPGSESLDPRPESSQGYGAPTVSHGDGDPLPVNDHNWLAFNSPNVTSITVDHSPYRDWDVQLSAHGSHPKYGDFTFKSAWKDREQLRNWADKYLPEAQVDYKLRDGGY